MKVSSSMRDGSHVRGWHKSLGGSWARAGLLS